MRGPVRTLIAVAVAAFIATSAAIGDGAIPAAADPLGDTVSPVDTVSPPEDAVPVEDRDEVLGDGWQASTDVAWTTRSTEGGLVVLAARESDGYRWSPVATLTSSARADGNGWISNGCLLGDGVTLAVVFGPRGIADSEAASARGASAALVNLESGEVRFLKGTTSIARYNPGCGLGDDVALVSDAIEDDARTKVSLYDGSSTAPVLELVVDGVVTSPVPDGDGVIVAVSGGLSRLDSAGGLSELASLEGEGAYPYDVHLGAEGGIVFAVRGDDGYRAYHLSTDRSGAAELIAESPLGQPIQIGAGAGGSMLLDAHSVTAPLPAGVSEGELDRSQSVSSDAQLLVEDAVREDEDVTATVVGTGQELSLQVGGGEVAAPPASGPGGGQGLVSGPVYGPLDNGPSCAVGRNNAARMAYQPRPRQVEWAVDMVVENTLNLTRPANWKSNGLASYNVNTLIGRTSLSGGGAIPAQILLGILAQESNLWQASKAKPGEFGNPLVGNYYGRNLSPNAADPWSIDYSHADCGYGIAQITDGMRASDTSRSALQKDAIALDYVANIAEAANILAQKWNQTRAAGMTVNNGDPQYIENWYFAVWAYNTGFYPQFSQADGAWGVGWANNPANPRFDQGRDPFLTYASDAANPQHWPYQETVFGWAAFPIQAAFDATTYDAGYSQAWWLTNLDRYERSPAPGKLCQVSLNDCAFGTFTTPNAPAVLGEPAGPCQHKNSNGQYDLRCYFHHPITYKDAWCDGCGRSNLRYDDTYGEPVDGASFPPNCATTGLPAGSVVVDDQPASYAPHTACSPGYTPTGSFSLEMGSDSARIDLHQNGGGARGHVYYSHMLNPADAFYDQMWIKGTWQFPSAPASGWGRLLVHLPDHGAEAQQAGYVINTGSQTQTRYVNTKRSANAWVSLGVFNLTAPPKISLTNVNIANRKGADNPNNPANPPFEEVAWDAIAMQPLAAKPANFVVALGDSYASGEGAGSYAPETDVNGEYKYERNACHRSANSWSRKSTLPGSTQTIGQRADALDPALDYHAVQCSGATTAQILGLNDPMNADANQPAAKRHGVFNNGEVAQLDAGYLDSNTTLVTLSIGGNDAYFAKILESCVINQVLDLVYGTGPCSQASAGELAAPLGTTLPARMTQVQLSVQTVLQAIHTRAPNAKVLLMGYPKLMSYDCAIPQAMDASWMNDMAELRDTHLQNAVNTVNAPSSWVRFANPVMAFNGHGACAPGGAEFIHHVVTNQMPGEEPKTFSQQSFHPNVAGAAAYAGVATTAYGLL